MLIIRMIMVILIVTMRKRRNMVVIRLVRTMKWRITMTILRMLMMRNHNY